MASSVLEVLRGTHEELEKLEHVAAELLLEQEELQQSQQTQQLVTLNARPRGLSERKRKEILRLQLAAAAALEQLQAKAAAALEIYQDADGLKADEALFLGGQRRKEAGTASGTTDVWVNFYDRLKEIRSAHKRRHLSAPEEALAPVLNKTSKELLEEFKQGSFLEATFDEAEGAGRRVAMEESFKAFCDLKRIQKFLLNENKNQELTRLRKKGVSEEALAAKAAAMEESFASAFDYVSFLRGLGDFTRIPRHLKYRQRDYEEFLRSTADYLTDFFYRRNPLADGDKVEETITKDFERLYSSGQLRGWEQPTHKHACYCRATDHLLPTPQAFEAYQRGKKHKKKLLDFTQLSEEEQDARMQQSKDHDKELALLEFRIKTFKEMLQDAVNDTIAFHQKKQSTNPMEAEEVESEDSEDEEAEAEAEEDDSDAEGEEGPVYNPLNLPLGQEFKCEICGNFSYWGRRAFERHFSEWRHSFGMQCLRIPNTTHFKEITKIEDAILLYEKLKKEAEGTSFKQDQELECEDTEGNVMNLRAYEDLRRQGLI